MPNVWYIANGNKIITDEQWAQAGVSGSTVTWGPANGWSVDQSLFSEDQLTILDADPDFLLGQIGYRDLPEPPEGLSRLDPSYGYWVLTKQIRDEAFEAKESIPDDIAQAVPSMISDYVAENIGAGVVLGSTPGTVRVELFGETSDDFNPLPASWETLGKKTWYRRLPARKA